MSHRSKHLDSDYSTAGGSLEYPATRLLKSLLDFIGTYEKSGRHVNLSRQLSSRSIATYNAINQLIDTFSAGTDNPQSFDRTFKDFNTVFQAIPVLERILLQCYFLAPTKARRHVPDGDTVEECIAFIETWFADRELLTKALDKFKFEGLQVKELQEGYSNSIIEDNKAALEAIAKFYQYDDRKVKDRHIYGRGSAKPVTELKNATVTLYQEVIAKPHHGGLVHIALKSLMLTAIPLQLLDESRVTKHPLKIDHKNHLKNYEVWKAMVNLTNRITNVAKKATNDSNLDALKGEYEALKESLLKVVKTEIDNLRDILHLIRLSAYIQRPFQARTVALIKALRYLDEESDNTNVVGRYELNTLLKSLSGILNETRDLVKDVRTFIHLTDLYDSQAEKFQHMFDAAKQCSKELNLSTEAAWGKHEVAYQAAVVLDKNIFDDAAKFFSTNTKP